MVLHKTIIKSQFSTLIKNTIFRTFTDETPYMEENKENMNTSQCKNASFETLNVLEPNETVKPELDPKISNSNDRQKYTKEALKELQNLIEDV